MVNIQTNKQTSNNNYDLWHSIRKTNYGNIYIIIDIGTIHV